MPRPRHSFAYRPTAESSAPEIDVRNFAEEEVVEKKKKPWYSSGVKRYIPRVSPERRAKVQRRAAAVGRGVGAATTSGARYGGRAVGGTARGAGTVYKGFRAGVGPVEHPSLEDVGRATGRATRYGVTRLPREVGRGAVEAFETVSRIEAKPGYWGIGIPSPEQARARPSRPSPAGIRAPAGALGMSEFEARLLGVPTRATTSRLPGYKQEAILAMFAEQYPELYAEMSSIGFRKASEFVGHLRSSNPEVYNFLLQSTEDEPRSAFAVDVYDPAAFNIDLGL